MNAIFNLLNQVDEELGNADQSARKAMRYVGKAESTIYNISVPKDSASLEAAKRHIQAGIDASERALQVLSTVDDLRPDLTEGKPCPVSSVKSDPAGAGNHPSTPDQPSPDQDGQRGRPFTLINGSAGSGTPPQSPEPPEAA
ncbi:hypothetical protein [Maricaulis sp. MIT060901]|uniref:hypothetical protein n=1 Tax=Maricaulis sp. MIT060901 TaxID=3096993 RepID=UPI00399B2B49